jgi:Ni,Fe-hydrogenase III large subunit
VLLELERLHNHVADIGALCNDVAYGIAYAHAQRIRERLLRLNEAVTGHRLLRGAIHPGGATLRQRPDPAAIRQVAADLAGIVDIALHHHVIRERFAGTAVLTEQQALDTGALGYVARASGVAVDARQAHPFWLHGPADVVTESGGDVLARFLVRAREAELSAALLAEVSPTLRLAALTSIPIDAVPASGVGIVEGWRGTIVHRLETGPQRRLTRLRIVDPSFHNWPALPLAMADTIVPDFPLANKSFNLSYAGNDL